MASESFRTYRRRLPHWRASEAVYFVTWRLARGQRELAPSERTIVMTALRHFEGQRYHLIAFVVMNDHVHAMIRPIGDSQLEDIVRSLRSYSSHEIARGRGGGRIWQDEYLDRVVRDENEMSEKFTYILNNPFKRWPEIDSYEWVWPPRD